MSFIRYNIAKPRQYQAKDGAEKTAWDNIGTYLEIAKEDGTISRLVEIPAIGLKAYVFPQKSTEPGQRNNASQHTSQGGSDDEAPLPPEPPINENNGQEIDTSF